MTERSLRSSGVRQCRICLSVEVQDAMVSPCQCRGSIEYVHLACLQQYFSHKLKTAHPAQRRMMRQSLHCQICKSQINCLRITALKRCVTCDELQERVEGEDIFFMTIYMLLYIGFHVIGIVLLLQDSIVSKIIGAFWLALSVLAFNYGLYKIGCSSKSDRNCLNAPIFDIACFICKKIEEINQILLQNGAHAC